ncbi:MAG: NAD-dependent epimerase/dehydratase family protein [Anaerolineales bacterium]|nr:NAD-dependent epimerase/dehydratase family protein [Anaerolineales bacterium]
MRALVTGGTGFLGRHLIAALLAEGDDVTALVRTIDRARALPLAVRPLAGDVTRPGPLRAALRRVDVLYHAAALTRVGLPPKDHARLERANVEATRALLTLAGEAGVERIVYTSTLAVYGDTGPGSQPVYEATPLPAALPGASAYAQSKHRAHAQVVLPLARQGLPVTLVCPGWLYGPGDEGRLGRLLRRCALGRLPVALGGAGAFSFTAAADAARGHRLAAVRGLPGETYFLPGLALSLRAFLAEAQRATGRRAPTVWVPEALVRLLAGALQPLRPAAAEALRAWAAGSSVGSPLKAQKDLGWQARPAAECLPEAVAWHQAQARAAEAARRLPPPLEPPG